MRKPSEYVAAALAGLRAGPLSDRAVALTCGGYSATVTLVGSQRRGEDDLTGGEPAETVRALALSADFPALVKGDAATVGDDTRIVTGATVDASGASISIGLSAPLERCEATVTGVRGTRRIYFSVGVLALDNGLADSVSDGFAPISVRAFSLVIPCASWGEATAPQIGDEVRFALRGETITARVTRCERKREQYAISARSR